MAVGRRHPARLSLARAATTVVEGEHRPLPADVPPGGCEIVPLPLVAARLPGRWTLEVDLVHEHVRWFDQPLQVEVDGSAGRGWPPCSTQALEEGLAEALATLEPEEEPLVLTEQPGEVARRFAGRIGLPAGRAGAGRLVTRSSSCARAAAVRCSSSCAPRRSSGSRSRRPRARRSGAATSPGGDASELRAAARAHHRRARVHRLDARPAAGRARARTSSLVDSLIPEYGGNRANIAGIEDARHREHLRRARRHAAAVARPRPGRRSSTSPGRRATSTRCTTRTPTSRSTAARSSRSSRRAGTRTPRRRSSSRRRGSSTGGRSIYRSTSSTRSRRSTRTASTRRRASAYHLVYGEMLRAARSVLRLTNTYGPRMRVKDDRQTFLGTWLRLAVRGEELLVFGDGTQRRDFTYVDDAVEAFLLAGSSRRGGRRDLQRRRRSRRCRCASWRSCSSRSRGGHVPARAVPGGAALDRHRRLLRRRLEDPRARSAGSRASALREGLERSLEYYREHGSVVLVSVPFSIWGAAPRRCASELEDAFAAVSRRGRFVRGPALERFEERVRGVLRRRARGRRRTRGPMRSRSRCGRSASGRATR